jgi:hypothetical protein
MSLSYELTVATAASREELIRRAFPERQRPDRIWSDVLIVDQLNTGGFSASFLPPRAHYVEAESESGIWEWDVQRALVISYSVTIGEGAARGVFKSVLEVIHSGTEDLAFTINSDYLLLTRLDGHLHRYRLDTWWADHPWAQELLSD